MPAGNPPAENPFQELIGRVRAGDERAAAELVRQYEPAIRRAVRVRLGDTRLGRVLDSVDVCQSVLGSFFVRAALGQYELNTPDQLLKLLVAMARNKLVDQVRQQRAARRDCRRDAAGVVQERQIAAAGPSPSQQVAAKELLQKFRERLSAEERDLAEQRARGREWADIAAERGDSPEAVRKRLMRAIDRVARALGLEV
jgi:RNA polymerase sigma factor (sigma-70 family)